MPPQIDHLKTPATRREAETSPKEQFHYHAAGLGGMGGGGGSAYIDSVILRDSDAKTWDETSGTLGDLRVYYCQNWRADVSALVNDVGELLERVKYSAYGVPYCIISADVDSDGDVDKDDTDAITAAKGGSYAVRFDMDLDGDVDSADEALADPCVGMTGGRMVLSREDCANRKGYAGYENDGVIVRLCHVRHRAYDATLGGWVTRDPFSTRITASLYDYVQGKPVGRRDPSGLVAERCGIGSCGSGQPPRSLTPTPPESPRDPITPPTGPAPLVPEPDLPGIPPPDTSCADHADDFLDCYNCCIKKDTPRTPEYTACMKGCRHMFPGPAIINPIWYPPPWPGTPLVGPPDRACLEGCNEAYDIDRSTCKSDYIEAIQHCFNRPEPAHASCLNSAQHNYVYCMEQAFLFLAWCKLSCQSDGFGKPPPSQTLVGTRPSSALH